MILSRGRGYLFIHIPKTGGTSMALALEARAMKDDLMLGDTPKAKFCFTLVRNPWVRVLSYYHWLRGQSFDHPAVALAKAHDFDGFVTHPDTLHSLRTSPARHYMTDAAGQERCDLYIRLEHLAEDLPKLEKHLGFALELPHFNRSERPYNWRAAYSPGARDVIAESCAEDITFLVP